MLQSFKKRQKKGLQQLQKDSALFGYLCLLGACLTPIAQLITVPTFLTETIFIFPVQCAIIGLLSTAVFTYRRQWSWLFVGIFCVISNTVIFSPYLAFSEPTHNKKADTVRVLLANTRVRNPSVEEFTHQVEKLSPHIVVLLEVDSSWKTALTSLRKKFPYQRVKFRRDSFGIAVLSSIELEDSQIIHFLDNGPPSITANLRINGKQLHLLATHPLPPISPGYFARREAQMNAISAYLRNHTKVIVAGDLNTPMWSKSFKRFQKDTKLRSTRNGYGILSTWPAIMPLMRIPIDHILVSEDIGFQNTGTTRIPGSDHLGVMTRVSLD